MSPSKRGSGHSFTMYVIVWCSLRAQRGEANALNKALKSEEIKIPATHTGRHYFRYLDDACLLHYRSKIKSGMWPLMKPAVFTPHSRPCSLWTLQLGGWGCSLDAMNRHRNIPEEAPASHRKPGRCPHVADDIMLHGVGSTDNEAVTDHDTKLRARLQRSRDVGIRLKKSKINLRQKSLTYPEPYHRQMIEARHRDGQGYWSNAATYWHGRHSVAQRIRTWRRSLQSCRRRLNPFDNSREITSRGTVHQCNSATARRWRRQYVGDECTHRIICGSKKPLMITCDASDKCIGAAVLQANDT